MEKEFPLIIWQNTKEYKQLYAKLNKKFQEVKKKLHSRGFQSLMWDDKPYINSDGELKLWIHSNKHSNSNKWFTKGDEALEYAKKYATSGWYILTDLEDFLENKGYLFERSMHELGFRRHKTIKGKWSKRNKDDKFKYYENKVKYEKIKDSFELERLTSLWKYENEWAGTGNTFDMKVGKNNLIYVETIANPFAGLSAETMGAALSKFYEKGHIAKEQKGFYIDATNVKLNKECAIYIKARNNKDLITEAVWPTRLPIKKFYDISQDLVHRIETSLLEHSFNA